MSQQRYLQLLLLFTLITLLTNTQKCQIPQKGLYISYNALSKRDTLPNMFQQINTKIQKFNDSSYKENSTSYNLINMHPQMYYNEHHQNQTFLDQQRVKVVLGDIQFAFRMDYNIVSSSGSKTGYARGRVLMDEEKTFVKRLISNQGILEWNPEDIMDLTASRLLIIDHSQPQLTDTQKSIYQNIINDHIGDKKLKSSILTSFNNHYKDILKQHLNSQHLASDFTINYKYKNVEINYINTWKNYTLHNDKAKGLEVFYMFEIDSHTPNCSEINITFSQNQGGLQEVFSLAQIKNSLIFALEQGLGDVTVDKKWEVNAFQFFMGDLGNVFPAAYDYKPDDPFIFECKWDRNASDVSMSIHDVHQAYFSFAEICTAKYNGKELFSFVMDMSIVVRFYAEEESLVVVIISANKFGQQVTPIDEKFSTFNSGVLSSSISQVLNGMVGSQTFGTGWKTYQRRFPSLTISSDFLTIFDPSQR